MTIAHRRTTWSTIKESRKRIFSGRGILALFWNSNKTKLRQEAGKRIIHVDEQLSAKAWRQTCPLQETKRNSLPRNSKVSPGGTHGPWQRSASVHCWSLTNRQLAISPGKKKKMSSLRNNKELQLGTFDLTVNYAKAQSNKGEACSFMSVGGAAVKEDSMGGNGKLKVQWLLIVWVLMVSHWLSCYWAKENFFFLLLRSSSSTISCHWCKLPLCLLGSVVWSRDTSGSQPPDSIRMRFLVLPSHNTVAHTPPLFLPTSTAGMAKWPRDRHITPMQPQHASRHGARGGRFQSVEMRDEIDVPGLL